MVSVWELPTASTLLYSLIAIFHSEFHPIFEALGYACGYGLYRRSRTNQGDFLSEQRRWEVIAAAAVGALVGSRLLGVLEHVPGGGFRWQSLLIPGGKTIVGGLLGGWFAVEVVKQLLGIRQRTGDLFAAPLCVGIAVGRIGCFLAGLADDTYGKPTALPWGVDFGDGIRRHPTQLYEVIFLIGLAWLLWKWSVRPHVRGRVFRGFLAAYLAWRLLIDFLKPQPSVEGMNLIQWACLVGLSCVAMGEIRVMLVASYFDKDR